MKSMVYIFACSLVASLANGIAIASCTKDGERTQSVSLSSGNKTVERWEVDPTKVHRTRLANGFELGRLSGRTIAVKAVPALLPAGTAQALLAELLDAIEQERRGLSLDELHAEIAASLACRAAIKINMPLAPEKMRWLIDELLRMENPATCPHGRPIILRITAREIERGFQRS